jgi:hypothetical protein
LEKGFSMRTREDRSDLKRFGRGQSLQPQAFDALEDRCLLSAAAASPEAPGASVLPIIVSNSASSAAESPAPDTTAATTETFVTGQVSDAPAHLSAATIRAIAKEKALVKWQMQEQALSSGSELTRASNATNNTLKVAWGKVTSSNTRSTVSKYFSLAFSPKTWDVGLDYVKAALGGNVTKIQRLNSSQSTAQVGNAFSKLSHSNLVTSVGSSFKNFGNAVVHTFKKV